MSEWVCVWKRAIEWCSRQTMEYGEGYGKGSPNGYQVACIIVRVQGRLGGITLTVTVQYIWHDDALELGLRWEMYDGISSLSQTDAGILKRQTVPTR